MVNCELRHGACGAMGTGRDTGTACTSGSACERGAREWVWPRGRCAQVGVAVIRRGAHEWPWLWARHGCLLVVAAGACMSSKCLLFAYFLLLSPFFPSSRCVSRCSLLSYACFAPCLFQLLLVIFYVYNAQIKTFWVCHVGHVGRRIVKEEKSSKRTASHSLTH